MRYNEMNVLERQLLSEIEKEKDFSVRKSTRSNTHNSLIRLYGACA